MVAATSMYERLQAHKESQLSEKNTTFAVNGTLSRLQYWK